MPPTIVVRALKSAKSVVKRFSATEYIEMSANGWVTGAFCEALGDRLIEHIPPLRLECPSLQGLLFMLFADSATTHAPLSILGILVREHQLPLVPSAHDAPAPASRRIVGARSRRSSLSPSAYVPSGPR
jgi:hypothetical protein